MKWGWASCAAFAAILLTIALGSCTDGPVQAEGPWVPWFIDVTMQPVQKAVGHPALPMWLVATARRSEVALVGGQQELWFAGEWRGLLILGDARETIGIVMGSKGVEIMARNPETGETAILARWYAPWGQ